MRTIFTLALLLASYLLSAQTMFIANRGASYLAPENTVAAVNLAWKLDADAVTIDIHISKDNRLMVIHDKTTKRTCNGKKNLEIAKTPSMLLRDQDAGVWKNNKFKGEKIPFLSEIIKTIPEGKILFVDLHCGKECLPYLTRCLEKNGKQNQLAFVSSQWETIVKVQEEFPENKCYLKSNSKIQLKKKMNQAAQKGIDGIWLKYTIADVEHTALAEDNNLNVFSWIVNDEKEAKRLLELEVNGIATNRPKWLKEAIEK